MKINGENFRSVWVDADDGFSVRVFDQTRLPWSLDVLRLTTVAEVADAIVSMKVRGAPLIGAVAAYGFALGLRVDSGSEAMERDAVQLAAARPSAINLRWAIDRMLTRLRNTAAVDRVHVAYEEAGLICDEDASQNEAIGRHGFSVIKAIAEAKADTDRIVRLLTHCNAGWIATVDWGTALAPIYLAHDAGIDVKVWVDETRPRNQGAALTAWELGSHGVPHAVVSDNAGGHLTQRGDVDLVIVGSDRVTREGDVANKVGTYLKALAARDNDVPFWVALPSSTIDWTITDGLTQIPIEERSEHEVTHVSGRASNGTIMTVQVTPDETGAANPAFDVTPARLVTGLITERGSVSRPRPGSRLCSRTAPGRRTWSRRIAGALAALSRCCPYARLGDAAGGSRILRLPNRTMTKNRSAAAAVSQTMLQTSIGVAA